jgi:cytochrome c5
VEFDGRAAVSFSQLATIKVAIGSFSMRPFSSPLTSAILSGAVVIFTLYQAGSVEARTPQDTGSLPARYLAQFSMGFHDSVMGAQNFALLQAAPPPAGSKPAGPDALPEGKGKDLAQKYCTTCHAANMWTKQHHNQDEWSSVIDNMVSKGLAASDDELDIITAYLAAHFGPVKTAPQAASPDAAPAPAPPQAR